MEDVADHVAIEAEYLDSSGDEDDEEKKRDRDRGDIVIPAEAAHIIKMALMR